MAGCRFPSRNRSPLVAIVATRPPRAALANSAARTFTCRLVLLWCVPRRSRRTRPMTSVGQPQAARNAPAGQSWSVEDSLELYNVPAWGRDTSRSMRAGHVVVRPDTTAAHEIDLFEVVQGLQERDLSAPVVVRFSDILAHRLRHLHDGLQPRDRRERLPQPLHRGLPDQGQPAAPGGRGGVPLRQGVRLRTGGRLQAGAAGGHGDDRGGAGTADHLQRLQGLELHRGGDPRHQARAHHHAGDRELRRARTGAAARRHLRRAAQARRARQAGERGLGAMARLGRREDPSSACSSPRSSSCWPRSRRATCRTASSSCTAIRAASCRTSAASRTRSTSSRTSTPNSSSWVRDSSTSMSAAAWASTTTAPAPISPPR